MRRATRESFVKLAMKELRALLVKDLDCHCLWGSRANLLWAKVSRVLLLTTSNYERSLIRIFPLIFFMWMNWRKIYSDCTFQEKEYPDERIKFGREVLHLDSWTRKLQYAGFCDLLGPGTNLHLASNEFLRDIFGLGTVLPTAGPDVAKLSKMDRVRTISSCLSSFLQ